MNTKVKSLCGYIFPAMGGLFVTYLYNVVDGIFVGQGVGSAALGAVNIAVPFITFVVAIAAMFPMGGATVVAIRMGREDKKGANQAFMTAITLTLAMSVLLMIVGMVFSQQIVDISGASKLSDEMRKMAADYLLYYSAFSIPMLMSTCLSVFVRNDGSPTLSFIGMCVGAIANIFLDWLFIFPFGMGIIGAAVASGLGQVFSVLVLLSHFWNKKGRLKLNLIKLEVTLVKKICKRGVPEAISQLTTPVAACQGHIHHFSSLSLDFPCFPCSKSWRMTRFSLSSTLWILIEEKCTSTKSIFFCKQGVNRPVVLV